jgi:hypothetical protein
MCTEFEYDEAILSIKPHAPNAVRVIEQYVRQLKRLNEQNIEAMRMAGINAVGLIEVGRRGMDAYKFINQSAKDMLERSK